MGIGQRNINAHSVKTIGGAVCLALSYVPCVIALVLIGGHIYAYYSGFVMGILVEAAQGYPSYLLRRHNHDSLDVTDGNDDDPLNNHRAVSSFMRLGGGKNPRTHLPFVPSASSSSSAQTLLMVYVPIGTLMFALVLIAYLRTVFTQPGYVPQEPWCRAPTVIEEGEAIPCDHSHFVTLVSHKGELRQCRKCSIFKPDDAHHCSQCERCIHRMDHHCPWVNNCVGRNNTKFFIQFLLYISVGSAVIVGQVVSAYSILQLEFSLSSLASHIAVMMLVIGCSCFALFLGCFGGAQLYMVYAGDSTLGRVHDHLKGGKEHFYDVFGRPSHWVYHLLPTAPHRPKWASRDYNIV